MHGPPRHKGRDGEREGGLGRAVSLWTPASSGWRCPDPQPSAPCTRPRQGRSYMPNLELRVGCLSSANLKNTGQLLLAKGRKGKVREGLQP